MTGTAERKLTTIFCADVAGYSAMMDRNEDTTLATLKDYRGRMSGLISRHRGRVVNTAGDGLMAEFASPVEAVRCATEVQRELGDCNATLPRSEQMNFRIGINLGDVMVDEDDLFGEGVNIAARLESLADPGGILIASTVFDQVKTKMPVKFDFLGEKKVKNISEGIPTYRVTLAGTEDAVFETTPDWSAPWSDEEEESLASYRQPRGSESARPDGTADPEPPRADTNAQSGTRIGSLFDQIIGRTENAEAKQIAKRSGIVGLVLAAIGIVTPLDWVIWPAIAFTFAGFQVAINRAGWPPGRTRRTRLISIIGLLFAINVVASFGNWWFVYPSIVLGIIAFFSGGGERGELQSDKSSS
ncbi:MAG: adenylate/guanylate cyclase domain-containing protein [Pseudomonadota bacterium]